MDLSLPPRKLLWYLSFNQVKQIFKVLLLQKNKMMIRRPKTIIQLYLMRKRSYSMTPIPSMPTIRHRSSNVRLDSIYCLIQFWRHAVLNQFVWNASFLKSWRWGRNKRNFKASTRTINQYPRTMLRMTMYKWKSVLALLRILTINAVFARN